MSRTPTENRPASGHRTNRRGPVQGRDWTNPSEFDWFCGDSDHRDGEPREKTLFITYERWTVRDVVAAHPARQTEDLRAEFDQLADAWREETAGYSLAAQYAAHPAYRRIIEMGRPALPLIFGRLADQGGRWYVALHAITNANPVEPEDRGQRNKVREAWLDWARSEDIISH